MLATGSHLGPYEITGLIGQGGMGQVYKARDTRLNRIVALKVSHEQFTERFQTEARAIAALEHPHICRLYDISRKRDLSFLVMEYVVGAPLTGPLPLDRVLAYAGQIAGALDEAHSKGIVRREHAGRRGNGRRRRLMGADGTIVCSESCRGLERSHGGAGQHLDISSVWHHDDEREDDADAGP